MRSVLLVIFIARSAVLTADSAVVSGSSGISCCSSCDIMPHKHSKEVLDARRDRAIRRGYLQPRVGRTIPVPANVSTSEAKVVLESMDRHASHALISGNPSHWARESTAAASSKIAPTEVTAAFKLHSAANKAKHDVAKNAFKRASGARPQWPTLTDSMSKTWADIKVDDSPPSCSAQRTSPHLSPPPSSASFLSSPPQCSVNEMFDLDEQMPIDSDRTASAKVELLSNAHVKVVSDGRFSAGCSTSNGQSFYLDSHHPLASGERNKYRQADKELHDQVVMLRAENEKIYQEVAELRNENLRLFDNSAFLQQELCGSRAQLQAAESAMGVWASHATALEEQLLEQRRQCFLGMSHVVDSAQLSWHGVGGEPQFLGVYGHLQSGSGSEFRFSSNPCSPPCSQLQCGSGSGLRIDGATDKAQADGNRDLRDEQLDDGIALRVQVIERQVEKASDLHGESLERISSLDNRLRTLSSTLGSAVQESLDKRFAAALDGMVSDSGFQELMQAEVLKQCSGFLLVSDLQSQLEACNSNLLAELMSATRTYVEGHFKTHRQSLDGLVDKEAFHNVLSDIKVVFDVFKDGLERDLREFRSQQQQVVLAFAQSQDDGEKANALLWEAIHVLKKELKESMCTMAVSASPESTRAASTSSSLTGHASPEVGSVIAARPIRVGDTVCTHSLSFLALNDKVGIVVGYNKTRKRYAVSLASEDGQIADKLFKAENLQLCDSHGSGSHNAVGDEMDLERQVERAEVAASYRSIDDLLSKLDLYTGNDVDILSLLSQHEFIQSERAMGRAAGDPEAIIAQSLRVYMEQFVKTKTIVTKKFFSRLDEPLAVSRDEEHVNCSSSSDAHLVDSSF